MSEFDDGDDLDPILADQAETAGHYSQERAQRFYDRIRHRIHDYVNRKGRVLGKTTEFLLLVPDVFILIWRLFTDSRVAGKDKVFLGSAVAYYVFPFDLIPEALVGPVGYLDDLVYGVYVLNRILKDTDPNILREHWSGSEDILQTIQRVTSAADQLVSKEVIGRIKKMVKL
jgi:uncharacterized membrane protein YkvA (DUF1232 family)